VKIIVVVPRPALRLAVTTQIEHECIEEVRKSFFIRQPYR
jgi:hypothetical protein